jgi:hypothetical protein
MRSFYLAVVPLPFHRVCKATVGMYLHPHALPRQHCRSQIRSPPAPPQKLQCSQIPKPPYMLHYLRIARTHHYQPINAIEMDEKPPSQPQLHAVEDAPDPDSTSLASDDKAVMHQMGKRQQLARRFNIFTIFGLSLTLLSSWEAIGGSIGVGLLAGGPVSLVYGLMFTFSGTLACAASIAEMASLCPIAGAQYHWTYMFAPRGAGFGLRLCRVSVRGWCRVLAMANEG